MYDGRATIDDALTGEYLVVAIDVPPYLLNADTALMERARAAAVPIRLQQGLNTASPPFVRLAPYVRMEYWPTR